MALTASQSSRPTRQRNHPGDRNAEGTVMIDSLPRRHAMLHQKNTRTSKTKIASVSSSSSSVDSELSWKSAASERTLGSPIKDAKIVPPQDKNEKTSRSPPKRRSRVRGLSIAKSPSLEMCHSSQLQWDDYSWSPRKRRLAAIQEEEKMTPTSTKFVSAPPAKKYRLSPSSANKRHLRRCTLPADNSKAGEICKRLRNAIKQDTKERRVLLICPSRRPLQPQRQPENQFSLRTCCIDSCGFAWPQEWCDPRLRYYTGYYNKDTVRQD